MSNSKTYHADDIPPNGLSEDGMARRCQGPDGWPRAVASRCAGGAGGWHWSAPYVDISSIYCGVCERVLGR